MFDNQEFELIDKRECAVARSIGQRLRDARALMGDKFHQATVAALVGIDAKYLSDIENTNDVQTIPLWLIKRLAEVYDVSIDWLFGLVDDDWELCPENRDKRDFLAAIEKTFVEEQAKIMVQIGKQDRCIKAIADTVSTLPGAVKAVDDAFMQFWIANKRFDEMRAGNAFITKLDEALKTAAECNCQLVRFKALPFKALETFDPEYTHLPPDERLQYNLKKQAKKSNE